jgi:hypothetical protein
MGKDGVQGVSVFDWCSVIPVKSGSCAQKFPPRQVGTFCFLIRTLTVRLGHKSTICASADVS